MELAKSNLRLPSHTSTPMPTDYRPELHNCWMILPLIISRAKLTYYDGQWSSAESIFMLTWLCYHIILCTQDKAILKPCIISMLTSTYTNGVLWSSMKHFSLSHKPIFQPSIGRTSPEPRGNPVDANHAGNQVTQRSHSGILIHISIKL